MKIERINIQKVIIGMMSLNLMLSVMLLFKMLG